VQGRGVRRLRVQDRAVSKSIGDWLLIRGSTGDQFRG
jgi:hypothetical protein